MDDVTTAPRRAGARTMSGHDRAEDTPPPADTSDRRRRRAAAPTSRSTRRRLLTLTIAAALLLGALIAYALTRSKPWQRSGPPITVSGWAPYWQADSALDSFTDNSVLFSNLSLFAYQATAADAVGPFPQLGAGVPEAYRAAAEAAGVQYTASIIDSTPSGVMAGILADPASRAVHVDTIVRFARDNRFDGIDIDYEKFAFSDSRDTWETTRPNWVAFITDLAAALHAEGKTITVSVPSAGDYPVYDYEAMGKVVDAIRIMAYDYSTSEPGPVAPIDWVRDVVETAKDLVPATKLVLGVPVYGYDWPVSIVGTCPGGEDDQPSRRSVSSANAAALAAEKGVEPAWEPTTMERTFNYTQELTGTDEQGAAVSCTVHRVIWYPDAESVHARAYVAERQDLIGISIWSLGSDDPTLWAGIAAARADIETWPTTDPTTTPTSGSGAPVTTG